MASALPFALCFLVGLAGMFVYNVVDFPSSRRHQLWMAEHGRVYKDVAEKARRLEIFKKNVKYIEEFNRGGEHSYTMGVNKFADLTPEEFMAAYASAAPETESEDQLIEALDDEAMEPLNSSVVNAAVDWRSSMTRVKDQGACGCCFIFVAVATVESVYYIEKDKKRLRSLSNQQCLDCDKNANCQSGSRAQAYDYIIKNKGLNTDENYPYKAAKGTCDKKKERVIKAYIKSYKALPIRSETSLRKAVSKRPVSVSIAVPRGWQFYNGRIYDGPCEKEINHGVVVAGYGEEKSTKYWLVRNSWGSDWGDGGYIKMKRDVADPEGLCAIVRKSPIILKCNSQSILFLILH